MSPADIAAASGSRKKGNKLGLSKKRSRPDSEKLGDARKAKNRVWKGTQGKESQDSNDDDEEYIMAANEDAVEEDGATVYDKHAAFTDAMFKILSKSTSQSATAPILSKSKHIERKLEEEKQQMKAKKAAAAEKKANRDREHIKKPDATTLAHEIQLRKTATRGVIKLFNAIKQHRQALGGQPVATVAGLSKTKKSQEALKSKNLFMDFLKENGNTSSIGVPESQVDSKKSKKSSFEETHSKKAIALEENEKPKWDVLGDNYMMDANLKDWDKESSEDES